METKLQSFYKMNKENKEKPVQEFDCLKENTYFCPNKIEVRFINPEVGLGVVAVQAIKKDALIERCPIIPLDWRKKYHGDKQIHRYLYSNAPCQCQDCQTHGYQMFMVLGYGMIYNHRDLPNGQWNFNFNNRYADVVAVEKISKGQQIFVSYGNEYFKDRQQIPMD